MARMEGEFAICVMSCDWMIDDGVWLVNSNLVKARAGFWLAAYRLLWTFPCIRPQIHGPCSFNFTAHFSSWQPGLIHKRPQAATAQVASLLAEPAPYLCTSSLRVDPEQVRSMVRTTCPYLALFLHHHPTISKWCLSPSWTWPYLCTSFIVS